MVSSTDLIVIATVAQTVVITLTLLVFIFQFRSQEKAIREAAYQNVQGHYTDYVRMLVEKPELTKLLVMAQDPNSKTGRELSKLTPEETTLTAYILLGYGIFEEVYLLYKKRWIDEDTWQQWVEFLRVYSNNPLFRQVHEFSAGTFDKEFQDFVTKIVAEKT